MTLIRRLRPVPTALLLALALAALALPATSEAAPRPRNDAFAKATVISSLPYSRTASSAQATTEAGEPTGCGLGGTRRTLWYAFTATAGGPIQADLIGSTATWNLNIWKAAGQGLAGLTFVDCATHFGPTSTTFTAEAGATYYFQAEAYDAPVDGTLALHVEAIPQPPNDDFADATVIDPSSLPFGDILDSRRTTSEPGEPHCVVPEEAQTAWYSITPADDVVLRGDTSGTSFSTTITAYEVTGPGFGGLSSAAPCEYFNSPMVFRARAGRTYAIRVAAFPFTGGGDLHFNLEVVPRPANDDFADAAEVPSLPFTQTVETIAAEMEPGEPTPSCVFGPLGRTVWWKFTAAQDGFVTARAPFVDFSTGLAAYSGSSLSGLTELRCRRFGDGLTIAVQAGRTYHFQGGSLFGGEGRFRFDLAVAPSPTPAFSLHPGDPSAFETVQFFDQSFDSGGSPISSRSWDFGDGSTATGCCPSHRYGADGDYTVRLMVTTDDGRMASTEDVISVRTHDVAITKLAVPRSGGLEETKEIVVGVSNKRYAETVTVDLYRSRPGGFEFFGRLTQLVPVRGGNRTTDFKFTYTFTADDALLGKVTFKAVATLVGVRDALLADNEALSFPVRVSG